MFYRIVQNEDGTVDVWLTPGVAVPVLRSERMDYHIRLLAVRGIDPDDPQWGGDLEGHIRRNYDKWILSAEEVEI